MAKTKRGRLTMVEKACIIYDVRVKDGPGRNDYKYVGETSDRDKAIAMAEPHLAEGKNVRIETYSGTY